MGTVRQFVTGITGLFLYMHRLRLWILVLTLLSLPGYGLAGLAHTRSCQLQMIAVHATAMPGDCCPGKSDSGNPCKQFGGDASKGGSCTPCKAGYNCKSPQSYESTNSLALFVVPTDPALTAYPPTLLVSHSTNGLWRPPRLI